MLSFDVFVQYGESEMLQKGKIHGRVGCILAPS